MKTLVFVEQRDGKAKKASLEALSAGRAICDATSGTLAAVVLGQGVSVLTEVAGKYGAETVYLGDDAIFASYSTDAYGLGVGKAAQVFGADVLIFAATAMGKDLAPRVATRLEIGLLSDVTAYKAENGTVTYKRPVYSGKAYVSAAPASGKPYAVTLRPNVFAAAENPKAAQAVKLENAVVASDVKAVVENLLVSKEGLLDVAEADIIVSGGRGMKGPENYKILEELAKPLGGAVGASRAAVDAGWIGHEHQVGQTGKVVSPTLYIACGISGAIQHLAGMSTSKVIVAINKDPEAPIFKVATYGIVGDLFDVVPKMTEAVKALKAQG